MEIIIRYFNNTGNTAFNIIKTTMSDTITTSLKIYFLFT